MKVMAIDPGPELSAYVIYDGKRVLQKGIIENMAVLDVIACQEFEWLAIERVKSYGMPVSETIFQTVWWDGRFCHAQDGLGFSRWKRIPRKEICKYVCNDGRAKDSNIRQALIDRFGKPGTKKEPNLIYGEDGTKEGKMKADLWAALAVAITFQETRSIRR